MYSETGRVLSDHRDPASFCSEIRKKLENFTDHATVVAFWERNRGSIADLRKNLPDLKTESGRHYSELLEAIYASRIQIFCPDEEGGVRQSPNSLRKRPPDAATQTDHQTAHRQTGQSGAASSRTLPLTKGPRRIRDKEHLGFVRAQPCVICGRTPSQAHHILYAQLRSLGRKVSDEWTIPLCAIHHRQLHDDGNEQRWWEQKNVDPQIIAQGLWDKQSAEGHNRTSKSPAETVIQSS